MEPAPNASRTHLDPSELGTKQFWDEAYAREISNNAEDAEDEGTIWFDDSGAEEKVIQYLEDLHDGPDAKISKGEEGRGSRIVDLGTGNGHMLFELRQEGWRGEMVGVDYSEASVQLARRISEQRHEKWKAEAEEDDGSAPPDPQTLRFERWDILGEQAGDWLSEGFDLVLDKGTFDAISLSAETDAQGRRVCETYRERVLPLIKKGAFLIITSCNWTRKELLNWFETDDGQLKLFNELDYPKFTFGGRQGQSVCTLVFQKCK